LPSQKPTEPSGRLGSRCWFGAKKVVLLFITAVSCWQATWIRLGENYASASFGLQGYNRVNLAGSQRGQKAGSDRDRCHDEGGA
jgi:hypothetical protein